MKSQDLEPALRATITAVFLLSPLVASGLPPRISAETEGNFGQPPSGECLPGQDVLYERPPNRGSPTRAVSRNPSTLKDRLSPIIREVIHPDPRAPVTLEDIFRALRPDEKVCR